MPSRYPVEVRKQVVELARSGTRVAQHTPSENPRKRGFRASKEKRNRGERINSALGMAIQ